MNDCSGFNSQRLRSLALQNKSDPNPPSAEKVGKARRQDESDPKSREKLSRVSNETAIVTEVSRTSMVEASVGHELQ